MINLDFKKIMIWISTVHVILFSLKTNGQNPIQFKEFPSQLLHEFKNESESLIKKSNQFLYIIELIQGSKKLNLNRFNFETTNNTSKIIDLSTIDFDGIIDFHIVDSTIYFLSNNGKKVLIFNENRNQLEREIKVNNPHSTLFDYSKIYVYNQNVYLIYNIDIALKLNNYSNFFIDLLDTQTKTINPIHNQYLNANVFQVSNYQNFYFQENYCYLTEILTGQTISINLKNTKTDTIFKNIFDKNYSKTNRVSKIEKDNININSSNLLDTINYYFDNEVITTNLNIDAKKLVLITKNHKNLFKTIFYEFDLNSEKSSTFYMTNEFDSLIDYSPKLNHVYYNGNKFIQVFNMYDFKTKQINLHYKVYMKL
jgi:hypothetical protein